LSSESTVRKKPPRDDKREREELAIRFVNTAAWRLRERPEERLTDTAALLSWLQKNNLGSFESRKRLAAQWRKHPQRGAAALQTALLLREALYQIFIARSTGQAPAAAALDLFNRVFARSLAHAALEWRGGAVQWGGLPEPDGDETFRPILVSAAALVTGPRAARIKQCQDARGCGWLFVDDSRAFNRRWCSMGDCGNIAKAHRHLDRIRRQRSVR
jgi:predicted RNA-binding Zn ribbon-like protein